jgi:hypothetical protein
MIQPSRTLNIETGQFATAKLSGREDGGAARGEGWAGQASGKNEKKHSIHAYDDTPHHLSASPQRAALEGLSARPQANRTRQQQQGNRNKGAYGKAHVLFLLLTSLPRHSTSF